MEPPPTEFEEIVNSLPAGSLESWLEGSQLLNVMNLFMWLPKVTPFWKIPAQKTEIPSDPHIRPKKQDVCWQRFLELLPSSGLE